MDLSPAEINELARIGVGLQYQTQVYNSTAVEIASTLLLELSRNGSYVVDIVGNITGNNTVEYSRETLRKFQWLPNDRRHGTAAIWLLMIILSGIAVTLRFYARWRYMSGLRKDDIVLFLAWLVASVNNAEDIVVVIWHNWEAHCWHMTLDELNFHYRVAAFDLFESNLSTFFFKSAFLIFYYDLYPSFWFRFSTIAMAVVVAVYTALCMIFYGLRCVPFDTWNHPYTYHCVSYDLDIWYAITAINIPIDLIIVCMPIVAVRNLKLPRGEKLAVMALIGVGALVCVASMVRLSVMKDYVQSEDVSRRALKATTWQLIEPHLGIICVSIPAMRKFFQTMVSGGRRVTNRYACSHDTFISRIIESRNKRSNSLDPLALTTAADKSQTWTVKSMFWREENETEGEKSIDVCDGSKIEVKNAADMIYKEMTVASVEPSYQSRGLDHGAGRRGNYKPGSDSKAQDDSIV